MKKILLIFVYLILYLGCSNKRNSENLHVKDKCTPFSYDRFQSKFVSHNLLENTIIKKVFNKTKASYRVIQIDNSISITMINENSINDMPINIGLNNFSINERNIINIGENKYCIDSLVLGNDFNNNSPSIINSISGVYKLNLQNNKNIAFFLQDLVNPITNPRTLIMLFDISTQSDIKYISIGFQASENINCFSDINNDGRLDLYYWDFDSDSLFLCQIEESRFQKSNYYLKINPDVAGFNVCKEDSNWPNTFY
jgi:hypothetical protein